MSSPQPPVAWPPGCQLWPLDAGCLPEGWTDDPTTWTTEQHRAVLLASDWLYRATGTAFGMCLSYLRPCRRRCLEQQNGGSGWAPFQPVLFDGHVLNVSCGCAGGCGCGPLCEIALPPPVHSIHKITIGGVTVDPSTYRVDNWSRLVRLGGACWPDCQDLAAPDTAPGTFAVWMWVGQEVPPLGRLAVTLLAKEFRKLCAGDKNCVLPDRVTSVTRQGVTVEMVNEAGKTNIKIVDDWVQLVNPYGVTEPMTIMSPDYEYGRTQTWPSLSGGPAPSLPPGIPLSLRHVQSTPQQLWTIVHNLGWYPGGIQVEGPAGETIDTPEVTYPDINTVRLEFNVPMAGVAYLS